jgi:hypothetical protein
MSAWDSGYIEEEKEGYFEFDQKDLSSFSSYPCPRNGSTSLVFHVFSAEREGFEPSLRFPVNSISSAASSTTRAPLRAPTASSGWTRGPARWFTVRYKIADQSQGDNTAPELKRRDLTSFRPPSPCDRSA